MLYYLENCFTCGEFTKHDLNTDQCEGCKPVKKANKFNFVIFKNYDGTVTSKIIPRETWLRLNA